MFIIFLLIPRGIFARFEKLFLNLLDIGTKSDTWRSFTFTIRIKLPDESIWPRVDARRLAKSTNTPSRFAMPLRRFYCSYIRRYGRSVLVIVRQVNASPDMRRAARISMYCGITHLRQIISSLNYIFPRRTPVTVRADLFRIYIVHRWEQKPNFSGHFPRIAYAPRFLDRTFRFMQIMPLSSVTDFYTCRAKKAPVKGVRVRFLIRSPFFFEDNETLNVREADR